MSPLLRNPLTRHAVTIRGNLDAPSTMLFVHGFGTDQTVWDAITPAFEGEHRVVLLDLAGSGRSHPESFQPHRYLNLRAFARDVIEVCDALSLRRAIAVGASVGAMICVLAALERPDLFSRMVMVGASARYRNDSGYRGGMESDQLAGIYRTITANHAAWVEEYARATMGNADRPQLAHDFARGLASIPAERVLSILYVILQSDHRAEVTKLTLPTLIVQTRVDPVVPVEAAEFLHRSIGGSSLRVIDAEGHLPHVSAPAEVIEAMREFLS